MKHNTQTVDSEIGHKQTTVYDEFVNATTRISCDVLSYTSTFNSKPITIILDNVEEKVLAPLVVTKACIHHNSVQYLDDILKNSKDEAPADFVESDTSIATDDDDLNISIL